uniref:Uncharacterized protein n=1 Tax=Oryza punctata TaxID=4537 RepID=A0A0E0LY60_ORYPU
MAPILRSSPSDSNSDSSSSASHAHQPPPRQAQESSDDEDLGLESSEEVVAHGTPTKKPPPPPPPPRPQQNGREVSDSPPEPSLPTQNAIVLAPVPPPLQPNKDVPPSDEDDQESVSDDNEPAPPTKNAIVLAPPPPPLPANNNDQDQESDSDDDEESALQPNRNVPSSDSSDNEALLQANKNVALSDDDEEDDDQESDSDNTGDEEVDPAFQPNKNVLPPELKEKVPLNEAFNGKRKVPPPEVGESPQQHKKKKALQTSMQDPAQGDSHEHHKGNTDIDRQFKEKIASYFFLGNVVSVLDEEHPDLFKEPFLKLADSKASAMDAKIKQLALAQVRVSLQRCGLEKELIKLLSDLLKHGESFKEVEADWTGAIRLSLKYFL